MLQRVLHPYTTALPSSSSCACTYSRPLPLRKLRTVTRPLAPSGSYQQHRYLQSCDPGSVSMGKRRRLKGKEEQRSPDQQQLEAADGTAEQADLVTVCLSCSPSTASLAVAVGSSLRVYDSRYSRTRLTPETSWFHLRQL